MRRDRRTYLWDVQEAGRSIETFLQGKQLSDYLQDEMLRSAVERKCEIIGEALSQALRYFPEVADPIVDAGQIIAFSNRLIHGYSTVDDELVWSIVQVNLPKLLQQVGVLLTTYANAEPNDAGNDSN